MFNVETSSKMLEKWDTSFKPKVIAKAKHLTSSTELSSFVKAAKQLKEDPGTTGCGRVKITPTDAVDNLCIFTRDPCFIFWSCAPIARGRSRHKVTQGAEWGEEEARLELQSERRQWEVSDCPVLKGTVKRRTLLQKLVGWAGGWLSAGGVCIFMCVSASLFACVCLRLMRERRRMTDDRGEDDTGDDDYKG
ncbi:hypothetical protein Q8A73_001189 [Channa argus]|nr:hypothetical protein Q8A73_001189 [Channa argus]